ncbi:MAG: ribonuclease III [Acidimicrobiia bacterium]|nr:ribonuclease III [Acidimicrobiia bacterium]
MPVTRDEVRDLVVQRLAEVLALDDGALHDSADLRDDLGAGDLMLLDLATFIEAELGERTVALRIDDEDLVDLVTVGDVVECVVAQLDGAGAASEGADAPAGLEDIDALSAALGVTFNDRSLVKRSLSHRSWCAENGAPSSNERLEFLGDSVLGLAVTNHVFRSFPGLPEGQLSEVRAGVVNARVLAEVASELGLGRHLLLGKGEDAAGGREKQSILADALEAVIAAVFLDSGFAAAEAFVLRCLGGRIDDAAAGPGGRDYKTRLQERAARLQLGRPRYAVRDEGPDHAKSFFATVYVDGVLSGQGEGRSKKEAEQAAAWVAYRDLGEQEDDDAGAT